jgi:hypothetical protein
MLIYQVATTTPTENKITLIQGVSHGIYSFLNTLLAFSGVLVSKRFSPSADYNRVLAIPADIDRSRHCLPYLSLGAHVPPKIRSTA